MIDAIRNHAVRYPLAGVTLALASVAIAACGGSSTSTNAGSAAAVTPTSPTTSTATGTSPRQGSTGGSNNGGTAAGSVSPLKRATGFAACMSKHGVKLPAPTASKGGATLDYSGVDTKSARYKKAVAACAAKLVGKLKIGKLKLKGIHVKGFHLRHGLHIGAIEVPELHVKAGIHLKGTVSVPSISVPTPPPPPNGEPPTEPQK
jgi:hypothetical protein